METIHLVNDRNILGNYVSFCGTDIGNGEQHLSYNQVAATLNVGNCGQCHDLALEAQKNLVVATREDIKLLEKVLSKLNDQMAEMQLVEKLLTDSKVV